jgi:hypothetical protein
MNTRDFARLTPIVNNFEEHRLSKRPTKVVSLFQILSSYSPTSVHLRSPHSQD